jgi:NADPH2:quinone reductase
MRAIVIREAGGADVLESRDVPEPAAGEGQVRVAVEAIGVNYRDVYEREGRYGTKLPAVAGAEGAGTVVEVGSGVEDVAAGDRVAWSNVPASYAEQVVADAARVVPVPDGVSSELAAAALLQGMTAHYLVTDTFPVSADHVIVVHAAAGGVGQLLTQIAKVRGAVVVATASTDQKRERAQALGADHAIPYEGFADAVLELTDGEGAAAVFDGVGQATFDESLRAVRTRGTMVLYGAASGPVEPFDPRRLEHEGSLYLTRPSLRHYTTTREELRRRAAEVFSLVGGGRLEVEIGGRYALEDARRAHEDLESRRTTGKLLLVP